MIIVNGKKVEITKFPNNEVLIKNENIQFTYLKTNVIDLRFESNEDLIHLMFIKKYLDEKEPSSKNILRMNYIPYSRMDRTNGETVFTLKYLASFINSMNFDRIFTLEAHSNVSLALFDRIVNANYSVDLARKCMKDISFDKGNDYIIFPDEGAAKRYKNDFNDCKILTCEKVRNFSTGEIESLNIDKSIYNDYKAIIVDDLCSFGRTFVMAAEAAKTTGASQICLCITHSEEGLFKGKIFDNSFIDKVYTTDSICEATNIAVSLREEAYNEGRIIIKELYPNK